MLREGKLVSEKLLESMIVHDPRLLSDDLLIVGRQVKTESGGYLDLLALHPDGSVVLIEVKKGKTPREVVAQALDYASWIKTITQENVEQMFEHVSNGSTLAAAFLEKFGQPLDEVELNQEHRIIIVAADLDPSTERIIEYLNDYDVPINFLRFQVFDLGEGQVISRTWLIDPLKPKADAAAKSDAEDWNGEVYCSYGVGGGSRSWDEAIRYGFISAGGGVWYTQTLRSLRPGERIWVKIPGSGFVGVGLVQGEAVPAMDFVLPSPDGDQPAFAVLNAGHYHEADAEDEELCEYFVPVRWLDHKPLDQAVHAPGMFGNQNTVCRPTAPKWRTTVEQLKAEFPGYKSAETQVH